VPVPFFPKKLWYTFMPVRPWNASRIAFNKIRLILLYNGDDSVMYLGLGSDAY
jgi:hypothetical protein